MKASKSISLIVRAAATVAITLACVASLFGQTAATKSTAAGKENATRCSVQVERVDAGKLGLADSFQMAIYENLLTELKSTKAFDQVFRDGDRGAQESGKLLILKTMVEKYTEGSETKRAVTTVSGATKLTIRSQLITRDGKVILDRTVNGEVRFFGSNLRATHNLASNIANIVKQAQVSTPDQPAAMLGEL